MSKEISKEKTNSLLKCPFCGGEIKQMFMNEETFTDCVWDESIGNVSTWFKCYKCDSEFFHDEPIDTPEKQAEWWNTRKPMQNIVERLEHFSEETFYRANGRTNGKTLAYGYSQGIRKAIKIVKEEGSVIV